MDTVIRPYEAATDLDAVARIWLEIGWLDSDDKKEALGGFLEAGHAEVALIDDEAECMVHWTPGSMRYQNATIDLCAITAVTTSQIARKQGFASRLTTRALAAGAAEGRALGILGMFDQGFYDRLGFGTGAYDYQVTFDPASLLVDHIPYRPPVRVPLDDWTGIQRAMATRLPAHGAVTLDDPKLFAADIGMRDKMFALGYRDEHGELTHFLAGSLSDGHGPWDIGFMAYRSTDQLLELLRLLRELSDQIRSVKMIEPAHVQLQALLREPIRQRWQSLGTGHESVNRAFGWYQLRMLDVATCVAARSWTGPAVRYNLTLTDPLAAHLDGPWRGVGGDYTITIGAPSSATPGHTPGLPLLSAGVGSFTRLWLGVRPPTVLAVTDELSGPPELLEQLDEAMRLPYPIIGWDF
ncbi:MAG: GNAT family N-acetyltransferase [Actinomycetota bacterium]